MDFKQIETFLWVATLGSFRAAGERLGTSQPSVSARIAALERSLNVELFDRSRHETRLTSTGLELLQYAEKIVALHKEAEVAIADRSRLHGVVRLGVIETIVHTWLPALVRKAHEAFPQVSLELTVDTSPDLRDALVGREIDLAFLLGPISEPNMKNRTLCTYPLVWVASPALDIPRGQVPLRSLAQFPIITYPRASRPNILIREAFRAPDMPAVQITGSSSLATNVRLAVDGLGVSALPPQIVARELAEGLLRVVETDVPLEDLHCTASYPAVPENPIAQTITALAVELAAADS